MVVQLRQVKPAADQKLVETLSGLLAEARRGKIVGIAYVTLRPRQTFGFGALGEASKDPLRALGAIGALWLDLQNRMIPSHYR